MRAASSAARCSRARRSELVLPDPPKKAQVIDAPSTAPSATGMTRASAAGRVLGRTKASPAQPTNKAATHKRNAEVPISESSINLPPDSRATTNSVTKYGADATAKPALDHRQGRDRGNRNFGQAR